MPTRSMNCCISSAVIGSRDLALDRKKSSSEADRSTSTIVRRRLGVATERESLAGSSEGWLAVRAGGDEAESLQRPAGRNGGEDWPIATGPWYSSGSDGIVSKASSPRSATTPGTSAAA
jgi:hypothetical protein